MNGTAVYAASLDPITLGHMNVVARMAPRFRKLFVLVAVASRKNYTFSMEERVAMAKKALEHFPNVEVLACKNEYVVKMAHRIGARTIIRGLRDSSDLQAEQALAEANRKICGDIETIFVPCLPDLMYVSSSAVKAHVGADPSWPEQVADMVPPAVLQKLIEKEVLAQAKNHWTIFSTQFNSLESDTVFANLVEAYRAKSENDRAYHNLGHIVSMLDEFERTYLQLTDIYHHEMVARISAASAASGLSENSTTPSGNSPAASEEVVDMHQLSTDIKLWLMSIRWAIWHHDAYYDAHAKDNEEKSAEMSEKHIRSLELESRFGEAFVRKFIIRSSALIMATKHAAPPTQFWPQVIVDLDLMILGTDLKKFNAYEDSIRKEYHWVPDGDFRAVRSRILKSFLDRSVIFSTVPFFDTYEGPARANLKLSINRLADANADDDVSIGSMVVDRKD